VKFSSFIKSNLDAILEEWDAFARTLLPAARVMTDQELRDHAREILLAIAKDMEISQSEDQRSAKSKRISGAPGAVSAGASHGGARHVSGFELPQLVGEFRALRASVLSLWSRSGVATEVRTALEEIARFNEAVDQALAESVDRYSADVARSRDIFLAVLAHDVRGPLAGIRMATDVLVMPTLAETMRMQVVMRIRRASEVIGRLTSDLIEYTRSRLGRGIPIERSACDLLMLCEETLDAVKGTYPEQQFVHQFYGDLRLELDATRMQQVLFNLLHNAVQHGDRSLPVTLHVAGEEDAVVLKVANFGTPIAKEEMQTIFEPLITVPLPGAAQDERSRTSLGLGLFIVREIVQGHQGTISLSSAAHTGTVFTVRLPRLHP
jgi:hypothetical protein